MSDPASTRFVAKLTFTNSIDAMCAVDQLRNQHFTLQELPSPDGTSDIQWLADIVLDGNRITNTRVRGYLNILMSGYGGRFDEITD